MPAFGQYGASPTVAMFQGFLAAGPTFVTRSAQNCAMEFVSTGVFVMTLNTGSVDPYNYLAQVNQYGESPIAVAITYASPNPNQITFTFGTPTNPGTNDLFNIVVWQCSDGLDNTGLIEDV